MFIQYCLYFLDGPRVLLLKDLVSDGGGELWPGMFHAEAGRGNKARVTSTREAISGTAASYAISDERGEEKRFWTTGNEPQ